MPTGAWSANSSKSLNLNFVDWKYCQNKCREKENQVFSKRESNLNKSQQFEDIENGNVMNKSSRGGFAGRRTEFSSESNEAVESKKGSRQSSTRTGLPKVRIMDDSRLLEAEESKGPGLQPQDMP